MADLSSKKGLKIKMRMKKNNKREAAPVLTQVMR
jgi:hypothetical protein